MQSTLTLLLCDSHNLNHQAGGDTEEDLQQRAGVTPCDQVRWVLKKNTLATVNEKNEKPIMKKLQLLGVFFPPKSWPLSLHNEVQIKTDNVDITQSMLHTLG